tara:strand:- start:215 stop:970 length:756 start_codon:yes stop_codon:yes gene_type:complete
MLDNPVAAPAAETPVGCTICDGASFNSLGQANGYDIFRCAGCGFCFVHPTPPRYEIEAIYDEYSSNEAYRAKAERKVWRSHKRLKRYRHLAPGKRFIDFGCNIGTAVEAARRLGFDAYGVDIDRDSVGTARKIFPGSHFHTGSIESLPDNWRDFDLGFSVEVIEHIPDPHPYFEALAARLRSGGVLYLTTPDAGHWRVPADFTTWREVFPPDHLHFFTRTSMTHFLDRHGFDVIKFVWNLKTGLKLLARKR